MDKRRNVIKMRYSVLIFIMFVIMLGSAAGSYAELRIDTDFKTGAMEYIDKAVTYDDSVSKSAVFKESFKNNGKLLLVMAIGGLTIILFPAAIAVALYKGVSIGFTSALIMDGAGKEGIISCCSSLLLHNCIFIAAILIYGYFNVSMAVDIIKCKNKRKKRELYLENIKQYLVISAGVLIILIIGAATEGYINPLI